MPNFYQSEYPSKKHYKYWVQNGAIFKTPAFKTVRAKFKVKTRTVQYNDLPDDLKAIEPFLNFKPCETLIQLIT